MKLVWIRHATTGGMRLGGVFETFREAATACRDESGRMPEHRIHQHYAPYPMIQVDPALPALVEVDSVLTPRTDSDVIVDEIRQLVGTSP